MSKVHLIFLLLCYLSSLVSQAYTERNFNYQRKFQFFTNQSYAKTFGNFDSEGGSYKKLPSGYRYEVIKISPQIRYGFEKMGFRLGGQYGYAISENSLERRTNGQLDSLYLGGDYVWSFKSIDWIMFINHHIAIYKNDLTQDLVAISDGVSQTHLGLEWRFIGFNLFWRFMFMYQRREFLSDLIKFQGDFSSKNLFLGIEGYDSVVKESRSLTDRIHWQCLANGCSTAAAAYNPMQYSVYLGYQSSSWGLIVKQSLNGKNSPWETQLGIVFNWESGKILKNQKQSSDLWQFQEELPSKDEINKAKQVPQIPSINPNQKKSKKRKSLQQVLDAIEQELENQQQIQNTDD